MKVVFAALQYDYGRPEQGVSFERQTFQSALEAMGHEVLPFDTGSLVKERGQEALNRMLWELVAREDPDLLFCVLFSDELDPSVVRRITEETRTVTMNWFCDDHWRFYDYSRLWSPQFDWVVTTASPEEAPYEEFGLFNVIRSQWACNAKVFRRLEGLPYLYDVSFVGMNHGDRPEVLESLSKAGVEVAVWGSGWPAGRLSVDEMVRVFNQSRINLNFAHASVTVAQTRGQLPSASRVRALMRSSLTGRHLLGAGRRIAARISEYRNAGQGYMSQIKARNFEITGSGGFLMTQAVSGLDQFFTPDEEIVLFGSTNDLADQIRSYLADEERRRLVADAGHARVLAEHTYEHRFRQIFERMGLDQSDSAGTSHYPQ